MSQGFPPDPFWNNPQGSSQPSGPPLHPFAPQPTTRSNPWLLPLGIAGGILLVMLLVCCGVGAALFSRPSLPASAKQPFSLASIPVPPLPERGAPQQFDPRVMVYATTIQGKTGGYYSPPGHGGRLYVYLPAGNHAPGSLPCVLICGAGSTMLQGMELSPLAEDGDCLEQLPYARAGFAVVAYELDGPSPAHDTTPDARQYEAFRASCAGLVNARNALEFTLAKVPEVNPKQIFAAGHSSAAVAALLFAAHEPRLAGCIAYAPCPDLEGHFPAWQLRLLSAELKGVQEFVCQSSPLTHVSRIRCPTLLFHAEDDELVPIANPRKFVAALQAAGGDVRFITVPTGNHYDSMIQQGIPAGIDFIQQKTGRPAGGR